MTQPQDKTHADFEAHAKRNGLCIDRAPCQRGLSEKYWSAQTQHTWEGWQAACAQQSAQSQQDALDAARWRWLSPRLMAADFDWNETGKCALVFDWPANVAVGGSCNQNIDAAIAAQGASNV